MQVIARIPDVTAPPADVSAPADVAAPAGRPARLDRAGVDVVRPDRLRQTWPVAALAVAAAVAWALAARNEHLRLEQQRGELRVAREPFTPSGAAAPTAGGGAIVR